MRNNVHKKPDNIHNSFFHNKNELVIHTTTYIISEILLRAREARHTNVPNDTIYKKIEEEARLRYGDRNQVSGFWVLWLPGQRQNETF